MKTFIDNDCDLGQIDVCISEDSDLLAFGCKRVFTIKFLLFSQYLPASLAQVLYKMDSQGQGEEIEVNHVARSDQLKYARLVALFLRLSRCAVKPCFVRSFHVSSNVHFGWVNIDSHSTTLDCLFMETPSFYLVAIIFPQLLEWD